MEKHSVRASHLLTARGHTDEITHRRAKRRAKERSTGEHSPGDGPLVLGRYRLGARLGAGAFGTVWAAHDERLDREVAVKVVARAQVVDARLAREARAAARLSHPAIVSLYEAAADDNAAYLVSELVRGVTLAQALEDGKLSDRDIVSIGIALCDALAHAHAQGVIHRDVKPSNVLLAERPASDAYPVKLTDFGVARVLGGDSLTATGDIVGTDAYMSPEQAVGREAGRPADLYSLALVLYEALTGVNPVSIGGSPRRAARLGAHLPPLRRQRRDLPRELGRAIDLALRPRPRERGTIKELAVALSAVKDELKDTPGVVAGPWRPWTVRASRPARNGSQVSEEFPVAEESSSPRAAASGVAANDAAGTRTARSAPASRTQRWLAALSTAALAAWLAAHMLGSNPLTAAAVALLAAGMVLAQPRRGFGAITCLLALAAALQGHAGAALFVVVAMLVPVLLLPRGGTDWPLAAGATALGVVALAGAWPAVAARAPDARRRAALAATGWVWLAFAAPLTGSGLYVAPARGTPPRTVWIASLYDTVHHVLGGILGSGMLAPALVWALAAVLLPRLIRGHSLAGDAIRVAGWTAVTVSSTELVLAIVGAPLVRAPGAVLGAVAAALVALAPSAIAAWRSVPHAGEPRTGLS